MEEKFTTSQVDEIIKASYELPHPMNYRVGEQVRVLPRMASPSSSHTKPKEVPVRYYTFELTPAHYGKVYWKFLG